MQIKHERQKNDRTRGGAESAFPQIIRQKSRVPERKRQQEDIVPQHARVKPDKRRTEEERRSRPEGHVQNPGDSPERGPGNQQTHTGFDRRDHHRIGGEEEQNLVHPDGQCPVGDSHRPDQSVGRRNSGIVRIDRQRHQRALVPEPGNVAGIKHRQNRRRQRGKQQPVDFFPIQFHTRLK